MPEPQSRLFAVVTGNSNGTGLQLAPNYYHALRDRTPLDPAPPITAPVLVPWDEKDVFLERHVAERTLPVCTSGRLLVVPGTSHWLHIEAPDHVNTEVLRFLAASSAATAINSEEG